MQFQAPHLSTNTAANLAPSYRRASLVAAISLVTIVSSTLGCGSGSLSSTPPQTIAVPTASAKGPQLGYLWLDSDQTLRPILGVAGASQIGQSVVPARTYAGAVSAAAANFAVLQSTDGSFDRMTLPDGAPTSLSVSLPVGATMRLSPSATSALLYTPGATSASLVTNLLSTPQVVTVKSPAPIVDSAISDTGSIGFEYSLGTSFAISVTSLAGRSAPVANIGSVGGLSFLSGRDDLLFADAANNSLTLIRSATSAPASSLIQTSSLLKSPSAVGVSGSGRWALVVNGAAQTLVRVDLNTQTSSLVSCSCKPTEAAVLTDDGAFRVTNVKTGANWIIDAASPSPRTLFIPALAAKTSLVAAAVVP